MPVTKEGSVRVDLVGGTIDLEPINLILPNVVTLNVATSLKAKVVLEESSFDGVEIFSKDYDTSYKFNQSDFNQENLYSGDFFKEMKFVCQILDLFGATKNLRVTLSSGAPAGSGLGGSSAMGVTLYSALCDKFNKKFDIYEAVAKVKGTEGRILNQGVPGYQDYFPALTGGVLSIRGKAGELEYEQLFTPELKDFLEGHMTLVYSGLSRNSGINNWEVYKAFFDKNEKIRSGMEKIADISYQTYLAIKNKNYDEVLELIGQEGEVRKLLAPNIVPSEIEDIFNKLKTDFPAIGMKMCGAGGGGCFILTHKSQDSDSIKKTIEQLGMRVLDFCIDHPIQYS
ncbi:MAG: hypothetical protein KC478_00110 [Bacteriovoracaceae bacterium]|nr:hypothetical protein [Bacteriovoracaceae bacterium]